MAEKGWIPDLVLCSVARRAVETWDLVSEQLENHGHVEISNDIYRASSEALLSLLQSLPDSVQTVLLVGHNPTFEELALRLTGDGKGEAVAQLQRKYPTGALAVLDLPIDRWEEAREGSGFLRDFVRPKSL
jgi:phosphohistidine phosphatase